MDWKTYYQERHLTADEAVKHIKSGNRVLVGHACGEPSFLLDTMIGHKEDYENVEIVHMVAMGKCEYCQPGMEKHFHHNAYFVGARTRDAVAEISRLASFIRSLKLSIPLCRWM